MDFNQTMRIIMESPLTSALAQYRNWSSKEIEREKAEGVIPSKRSYVDRREAFDHWVKEEKISKRIAKEVEEAMNLKD